MFFCICILCFILLVVKEEFNFLKLIGFFMKILCVEIIGMSKFEGFSIFSCGQVFMDESEKDEMLWFEFDICF